MPIEITEEMLSDVMSLAAKFRAEGPLACKDDAAQMKSRFREKIGMKPVAIQRFDCSDCYFAGTCLADGTIPDFEIAIIALVSNLA